MAIWTLADRDAVKAAILVAATEGIASVTLGGQTVQARTLDELRRLLDLIQSDLAAGIPGGGIRKQQITPYYP